VRLATLASDLIVVSRIEGMAAQAGAAALWARRPEDLPSPTQLDLLLVDWADRTDAWAGQLNAWRSGERPRIVLFGPHTDLVAHAAARAARLGPMWARSRLFRDLPTLLGQKS
jgi:hypothetical protein